MRSLVFILLLGVIAASQARYVDEAVKIEWESFKSLYGKKFNDDVEESFRLKIYIDNKQTIAEHNQLFEQGLTTFDLKMNQFGDLLSHEVVSIMNGYRKSDLKIKGTTFVEPENVKLPASVDWRQQGAVTAVKDQAQCGSCYAFSTTGSLEGQHFLKTGRLVSLSEQNIVDCSIRYGNRACGGGWMDQAFSYIKDNNGVDTEESYPYEAAYEGCTFNPSNVGATVTGFVDIPSRDEAALKTAVGTIGPISVAIDASKRSFQFYSSGVYVEPSCSQQSLDHAVLAVGYGTENGQDFWLVKNSWNASWGMSGYINMARNQNNMCGIATKASYPLV